MDTPQKADKTENDLPDALTVEWWAYEYVQAREAAAAAAEAVAANDPNAGTEKRRHAPPQHQKRPFKIIHQLDYATSGVLLFAFYNKKKAAVLASLFERRLAKKMYVAYVVGHIHLEQFPHKAEEENSDTTATVVEGADDRGDMDLPTRLLLRSCKRGAFVERITHTEKEEVLFAGKKREMEAESGMSVYRYADTVEGLYGNDRFTGQRQERLQICLPIGHAVAERRDAAQEQEKVPGGSKKEEKAETAYFQMQIDGKDARAALTYLYVLEEGYLPFVVPSADSTTTTTTVELPVTKVALRPCTGRRHQLRLHCQSIGHPILGDVAYYHTDSSVNLTPLAPSSSGDATAHKTPAAAKENVVHCYENNISNKEILDVTQSSTRASATFHYTVAMAQEQRRMYLHAQCLALPLCVEALDRASPDQKDKPPQETDSSGSSFCFKEDAKRRRRIKLGTEKDDVAEELKEWTVFSAADDFEPLLSLH